MTKGYHRIRYDAIVVVGSDVVYERLINFDSLDRQFFETCERQARGF